MIIILIMLLIAGNVFARENHVVKCDDLLLDSSKSIGLREAGTLEGYGNSGLVMKYLKAVGIEKPAPYCAAGQYWCFLKAAEVLCLNASSIPIKRTAVANEIFSNAKRYGRKGKYIAKIHSLIVWRRSNSWQGHIERIVEVGKAGWVSTLAFNVRGGSGREGVFIRKRNIYHPLGRLAIRGMISFERISND